MALLELRGIDAHYGRVQALHGVSIDVEDETIECPRHGSVFDLRTGRPRSLPATLPVVAFRVKVEGETIMIELED